MAAWLWVFNKRGVLIANAIDQVPPEAQLPLLLYHCVVFALFPVGVVVYLRLLRRTELNGPQTRPDLFTLTDMLAISVVFGLIFLPVAVTHILAFLSPKAEAIAAPPSAPLTVHRMFDIMASSALPPLGMLAVFAMRGARLRDLFGFNKVPVHRALGIGAGLAILAYPLTAVAKLVVIWVTHSNEPSQKLVHDFQHATGGGNGALIAAISVSAVIIAPVCEELVFRGSFYAAFSRFAGRIPAALVASLIFALIHDTISDAPSLMLLALCFTLAYEATGSLVVPMAMHATFNGLNLLVTWWQTSLLGPT